MTKAAELAKMGEVLTNSQIGGRRNIVINGAMQVAQRSTSETGLGASSGYFTLDRWYLYANGTAGRLTMAQVADVHDGFANALKLTCTTADTSIAAGEQVSLMYRIEGQDLQQLKKGTSDAEKVTLSFYVKGNASATYIAELMDADNSSRHVGLAFNVTTDWTRVILTFPADTTGTLDDDNALSLDLTIHLHNGSNFTSGTLQTTWGSLVQANRGVGGTSFLDSTDRTFFITGVQMEVGSQATPFEHRSVAEELALCQRYLYRISGSLYEFFVNGVRNNTNYLWCPLQLPVPLRGQPAITTAGTSNNCFGMWHGTGGSWSTTHTTMGVYANPDLHDGSVIQLALALNGIGGSGFGDGQCVNLGFQDNGFLDCDAEL